MLSAITTVKWSCDIWIAKESKPSAFSSWWNFSETTYIIWHNYDTVTSLGFKGQEEMDSLYPYG